MINHVHYLSKFQRALKEVRMEPNNNNAKSTLTWASKIRVRPRSVSNGLLCPSLSLCLLIILYVSYLLYRYPPSFSIVFGFNFQIENRPRASFSWFVLQLFLPHKKSKICTSIQKMSKFYFLQYFAVMHVRTTYLPIFFFQTSVCM